jgi:uncharacterized membrane protein
MFIPYGLTPILVVFVLVVIALIILALLEKDHSKNQDYETREGQEADPETRDL